MQPHHFPRVGAIIHPGVTFGQLGLEHFLDLRQDAIDAAARRETGTPRTIEGPLYAQVEEMLQTQPCRQQRRLLTTTQRMQIVHRMPEPPRAPSKGRCMWPMRRWPKVTPGWMMAPTRGK
jgi:hypothetical protein